MREIKFRAFISGDVNKMFYQGDTVDENRKVFWKKWETNCHVSDPMQFIGLMDTNSKEVYEGDIIQWRTIQTEYQTHNGDNIPNGSYTEPCGVTSRIRQEAVVYDNCGFTVFPKEAEEQESACPLRYGIYHDMEEVKYTLFPGLHGNKVSEEEFADYVRELCIELKMNFSTIDQFINDLKELEVIGNIYENPELLKP